MTQTKKLKLLRISGVTPVGNLQKQPLQQLTSVSATNSVVTSWRLPYWKMLSGHGWRKEKEQRQLILNFLVVTDYRFLAIAYMLDWRNDASWPRSRRCRYKYAHNTRRSSPVEWFGAAKKWLIGWRRRKKNGTRKWEVEYPRLEKENKKTRMGHF